MTRSIAILSLLCFSAYCAAQTPTEQLIRPDLGETESNQRHDLGDTIMSERPDLGEEIYYTPINKCLGPKVFHGYRHLEEFKLDSEFPSEQAKRVVAKHIYSCKPYETVDSANIVGGTLITILPTDSLSFTFEPEEISPLFEKGYLPNSIRKAQEGYKFQDNFLYSMMVSDPKYIDYAFWDLPIPPKLKKEDNSFRGFLNRLDINVPNSKEPLPVQANGDRINWLHTFNAAIQLSQAYVSANWYQGGNSYLALLGNVLWDVSLNNVYHPKVIFQSTVSYKFSINSTPDDQYRKYSISQDQFQYNLKAGYKAVHNWYYSLMAQFKTQFFHSYPSNSNVRSASFLSPGDLNVGFGMTYSKENKAKTLKFAASISPVAYNLKTCLDDKVDHAQFGIKPDRKVVHDYGSNAEITFYAKLWGNTTYNTRVFLFSDYKTFQTDWENTFNFQFSKLFSTQIYVHLRYDTSADSSISRDWKKLMLKEILSVGLSYTFSTK